MQTFFDICFKTTGFQPVQSSCPPITDRGVSRGLLYISHRQALPTSHRRGFFTKMADDYYHFSDEDEREDEILIQAMERWEQMGGGGVVSPLFKFKMVPIGKRRTWRDVVRRDTFHANLQQLREAIADDNIGQALTEALHEAIQNEIRRQRRPPHHFVNFAITANGFQHAYQTINFTVEEFLNRTARIDELLHRLSSKLNSNESFNPGEGFSVEVVFVKMPGKGKGRQKNNPGQRCLDRENKKKKVHNTRQQSR